MQLPEETRVEIDEALPGAQSLSILQRAAKKREERESHLFLDVPSWDGDLVAEYRILPPDELKKMTTRVMRRAAQTNGEQAEMGRSDIDLIIAAAVGLSVRDSETGERYPITDDFGRVGYDRVMEFLDVPEAVKAAINSQAETIKYLMSEREVDGSYVTNVIAIGIHANSISQWMSDPSRRTVGMEAILGER